MPQSDTRAREQQALEDVERRLLREPESVDALFERAQILARLGRDDDAKAGYVAVLSRDPAHFGALTDLAGLALATGYRSAALTAYRQAVACHPDNPFGLVNLANLLLEDEDAEGARQLYERALASAPTLAFAHQGLAGALLKLGDFEGAARHRDLGFRENPVVVRPYRGSEAPPKVLLLVATRGGNIPTNVILDDHLFAVTALYADYDRPDLTLPPVDVVFNAVGDADLCGDVLDAVERIVSRTPAPVINAPARIRPTGRAGNAARLAALPDIVVPRTMAFGKDALRDAAPLIAQGFRFPLLLRSPGFHTGQNFARVETHDDVAGEARRLPGETLLAIEYLDARQADGMVRKYRVMFIGGDLYPLHLALSPSWKVHYFTSAMADSPAYREEERRFLEDMPAALGPRAMKGLAQLRDALGLDYGGADFGLAPDGRLLLFEANATMAIVPPAPDAIWDYRRAPIRRAIDAARKMLFARAGF